MKVSVVIPTYNRAAFLAEALNSVFAQTFQDFELIVVDDGSTDETPSMMQALGDARVRYLTQAHRGAAAPALNLGWRAARGEFIARLDSDDRWLPTLLQELVAVLDAEPTRGVAYARAQGMNERGDLLPQLLGARERFAGHTLKSLLYGDFVCPIAVVLRRAALERVGGYDESMVGTEDWDLWVRIAPHAAIAYVPRVLAHYRFHAHNLTRTTSDRMPRVMQDRGRVLDKFFAQPNVPSDALEIKPLAYRNLYLDWTIRYLERRDWKQARQTFQRALSFSPARGKFLPRALAIILYTLIFSKTQWGVKLVETILAYRQRRAA